MVSDNWKASAKALPTIVHMRIAIFELMEEVSALKKKVEELENRPPDVHYHQHYHHIPDPLVQQYPSSYPDNGTAVPSVYPVY